MDILEELKKAYIVACYVSWPCNDVDAAEAVEYSKKAIMALQRGDITIDAKKLLNGLQEKCSVTIEEAIKEASWHNTQYCK